MNQKFQKKNWEKKKIFVLHHAEKTTLKLNFKLSFQGLVGKFCATFTVTGYPCFSFFFVFLVKSRTTKFILNVLSDISY